MHKILENKIIIITRRTRLDDVIARFNTLAQAKFYVEHLGTDFTDYLQEDKIYKMAIVTIEQELKKMGKVQLLERSYLPNFMFGKEDVVVVVGQDGLVANTLKYLDNQPVVAINPDPSRWDGKLLPFNVHDASAAINDLFKAKCNIKEITFAKVETNNGQHMYGVNDLFVGPKTHISARYILEIDNQKEEHSSSGVIVSTGLGSTGWLSSILAGAKGVVRQEGASLEEYKGFDWGANYLYYNVREPFPSKVTGTNLIFGKIAKDNSLVLTSMMAQNGVIFSDGIETDFIEFNSGTIATVSVADKRGYLVI